MAFRRRHLRRYPLGSEFTALGIMGEITYDTRSGIYTVYGRLASGATYEGSGYNLAFFLGQLRAAMATQKKPAAARASTLPAPWDQLAPLGLIEVTSTPDSVRAAVEIRATFANGTVVYSVQSERALVAAVGDPEQHAVDNIRREFLRMHPDEAAKLPKAEPVPKRTGKALGFRSWKLEGYKLRGANEWSGGWKVGEPTRAKCLAGQLHGAPHPGCQCGLYALHAPEFMSRWHGDDPLMVHGAVLGWGRMQVHAEGWRAEYAQPVMLAYDGERQTYNHCERVKALGSELGLPVVPWNDFEREARKFGEPVPEELRPEVAASGYAGRGGAWGYAKWCRHCFRIYAATDPHCPSCGR